MLTATTDGLNAIFREDVGDKLEGMDGGPADSENLWSENEVYRYMTIAVDALAKATEGQYRVSQLPVTAAVQIVPISRNVLHIRYIRSLTTGLFLWQDNIGQSPYRTHDDYGVELANGAFSKQGPLHNVIRDYEKNALILIPIPTVNDTLEMQYTATQGMPQQAGMMLPFMDTEDQLLLLYEMKHQAYLKQDADAMDLKRAKEFEEAFKAGALVRNGRLNSYRRTPGHVQCDYGSHVGSVCSDW